MKIVKFSGDTVDFIPHKLMKSLLKAGASQEQANQIIATIRLQLYEGIATKQIYKMAFSLLKKNSNAHAARYNLREAIRLLGPAGFYFEKFIARLFEYQRYRTQSNLILQGKCVSHEIDILIHNAIEFGMVECKFHEGREAASDVKVPLYILSRFNDLKARPQEFFEDSTTLNSCWIVTNNRFTTDAIDFAQCSGLHLLSWNFPENKGLKTIVDASKLYPITCMTTLSMAEKEFLLNLGYIVVEDLLKNKNALTDLGLSSIRMQRVLKEVNDLCKN